MEVKSTRRARVGAKRLRRAMALPEVLLWQVLRTQPGGHRFRRQAPAGDYVLDFYCAPARLAIEVDGEAHSRGVGRCAMRRAMPGWSSVGWRCCGCGCGLRMWCAIWTLSFG